MPRSLSKLSGRGTPWVAILAVMVLSASFVLLSNIRFVAEITNFGTFVIFASVNFSAIWLRYRKPEWKRPFKTPVTIANLPLIPLLGLLSCGLMVTQFRLEAIGIGVLIIFIGIITQRILTGIQTLKKKSQMP
ncbi:amino acid permease [Candidatus Bathyarchaeota archaeon]|nr:amino acid permease [Candidatus Bathyarchaeota archaeon]